MRFTHKELASIEQTMDKLKAVAYTMCASESIDATNARYIAYIISEMRACAELVENADRATRVSGFDRLDDLLKAKA
jgi:hypothetical protein